MGEFFLLCISLFSKNVYDDHNFFVCLFIFDIHSTFIRNKPNKKRSKCFSAIEWICCCCLVAKLCPTHCDPMDCSLPVPSVYGIFQARILEWVAISFSMTITLYKKKFAQIFVQ